MAKSLRLGVLDQCKVDPGGTARRALADTTSLAIACDRLGLDRYWLAEHHTLDGAHAAPEVVIAALLARTQQIRVGAGGILLPYYSPRKVAEVFAALELLAPSRVDLGLCKGPGVVGAQQADELVWGSTWQLTEHAFSEKVLDLATLLEPQPSGGIDLAPTDGSTPELWLLTGSAAKAELAARANASLALPFFFHAVADGHSTLARYRETAAQLGRRPRVALGLSVLCRSSDAEARALQESLVERGGPRRNAVGSPTECANQIIEFVDEFEADEVLMLTWSDPIEERIASMREISAALAAHGRFTPVHERRPELVAAGAAL